MSQARADITQYKRWVIKIGSALLTNEGRGLDHKAIAAWVSQMATLRQHHIDVILVSSGSVAEGMSRLGLTERPTALYQLQAAAAVGQMGLIQTYESFFQQHGLRTAQILLTHDDLSNRKRYLNARSTLNELIRLGVVPIINENDTVTTDEIRFGDNDTLGGLVSNLIEADILAILTDQQGLYHSDPRLNPNAPLVQEAHALDPELMQMAGNSKGKLGRGGMATKIRAARLAARSGTATVIVSGREAGVLNRVFAGENLGSLLLPNQPPIAARKQWLASHLQMRGKLFLDQGASHALCHAGKSLLPVGVTQQQGAFKRGEMVVCINPQGEEIAYGLVNYNSDEVNKIIGLASDLILDKLGYVDEPELIHRNNLVLL
jgi:glutamate 5-kinase